MGKSSQCITYRGVEYFPRFTPNFRSLADIVFRAKGLGRSMRKFAKDCGISPATFSRIVQGRYEKALSFEMLEKIVNNADHGAMITMQEALYANGYIAADDLTAESNAPINNGGVASLGQNSKERVAELFEIITKELFQRKLVFTIFSVENEDEAILKSNLDLESFEKYKSPWILTFHIQGREPEYFKYLELPMNDEMITSVEMLWRALKPYFTLFLRDAWEPDTTKDVIYSFVFRTRDVYDMFVETMSKIKVNNYFSAVLLDTNQRIVVEEFMVPRKDGDEIKSNFS